MKKIAFVLAALPAFLPTLLLNSASASTIETANGSYTSSVAVTKTDHVGGNTIVYGPEVQHLTGALDGIRVASGVMIIHADGSFEARDKGVFTGTVDGRSGTVEIDGTSKGMDSSGSGQLVFGRGTGQLAGLHAQGTFATMFTSFTTGVGTYSVQTHFGS
jgi:hypothetical protein